MPKPRKQTRQPVRRNPKTGQLLPGTGSLNPGGIPRAALELRKTAMQSAPRALKRAAELIESKDAYAVDVGLRHILGRALGKESALADLPDDTVAVEIPADPKSLLDAAMKVLATNLGRLQGQVSNGQVLSDTAVVALADTTKSLQVLVEQQAKLAKENAAGALTDVDLKKQVLELIGVEELLAELRRRGSA